MQNTKIIAISGSTASGKSNLALNLAKKFNGVIVNADSKQIYKELNIGTAKPTPERIENGVWYIENIPHYLYGHISINDEYNVYKYQREFNNLLNQINSNVVFLVGGTGLYIDSIMYSYQLPVYNHKQKEKYKDYEIDQLQKLLGDRLNELNQSDRKNKRRLISHILSNVKKSKERIPNSLYLYLEIPKEIVNSNIEKRVAEMFNQNLVEENRMLFNKYKSYSHSSLQTIGYKEFEDYFKGNIPLEKVKELIIIHTKQYAKRQRTWFKKNTDIVKVNDFIKASQIVSNFLTSL